MEWNKPNDSLPAQGLDVLGFCPHTRVSGFYKVIYRSEGKWYSAETGFELTVQVSKWCSLPEIRED